MKTRNRITTLAIVLWLSWCFACAIATHATVPPLNSVGVATGCDNDTVQCEYLDTAVTPGQHFYFVVAENSDGYSGPSNSVTITVPNDGESHNVDITWTPSTTTDPTPAYFIYRGAPASNLTVGASN